MYIFLNNQENYMSAFDQVTNTQARPLPVIVLADTSGSMSVDGKLDSLKKSLIDMIKSFKGATASNLETEIYVSIISFGNNSATTIIEPKSASEIADSPSFLNAIYAMQANGNTPLGLALTKILGMLEHRETYPSRAYRPFLVLASDGHPNDKWLDPLNKLLTSERGKKATRLALAIGADADEPMLEKFTNNKKIPVFKANNANEIREFFKCVTITVEEVSQSPNPGEITEAEVIKIANNVGLKIAKDADDFFE